MRVTSIVYVLINFFVDNYQFKKSSRQEKKEQALPLETWKLLINMSIVKQKIYVSVMMQNRESDVAGARH